MMNLDFSDFSSMSPQKLTYSIHSWSSHSAAYHPSNILANKPTDQSSRWSSGTNDQMQYITLKLDKMSVISSIAFGKYHKVHVCNLKEFKVYGGLSPTNMIELIHSGLRNDTELESFPLKHKANGVAFPCLYIKIAPLLAWGANFNFSIWYVELFGNSNPAFVQNVYEDYEKFRETEVIRLCLKHFRQRNYKETFESLQKKTDLKLEDLLLTELHHNLVINGDFNSAEKLLIKASDSGLFSDYITNSVYKPKWRKIISDDSQEKPSMRGGHQMCIDVSNSQIYLFGGWDGAKELNDFWAYNINTCKWNCISRDTQKQNGPGPRSCHKIVLDEKSKVIYVLGRYVDSESRPESNLQSDFWKYNLHYEKWTRISDNTHASGGPELIYDHQMVMDSQRQKLYVFGGRVVGTDSSQVVYSGLYTYSVNDNSWKLLRSDWTDAETSVQLKSRIGHSMLLNELTRELYIFAGQRNKDYLADFYIYDIDKDSLKQVSRDYSKQGGPDAGFTQRATLDSLQSEVYVFSGLIKEKNNTQETVKNSLWVYNVKKETWKKIYQNENSGSEYWNKMGETEPCPRFAHQLVYDPESKVQYLFGGNPGESREPNIRLDDFWELKLQRPQKDDICRKGIFQIKKQVFREMCTGNNSMNALKYLQFELGSVVNHEDECESKAFRSLTGWLFDWNSAVNSSKLNEEKDFYETRTNLYESLMEYFPDGMREPRGNIVDLVPMN